MSFASVKLEDVCDIQIGRTPSRREQRFWDSGLQPWASIKDLSRDRNLTETNELISKEAISSAKMRIVPAGTVLMSFKLSIGKVAIARIDACTNEAIAALMIKDPQCLDRDFLARALESLNFDDVGDRAAKGKTLNKKSLAKIEIPLPPLDEQKRIAAILDQADELRRKRQRAIDRLGQLGQAIFHDMFGDPRRNPRSLPVANLGDVANFYSGNSLPEGEPFSGQEDGHLLLKVSDLNHPQNKHDVICAASWSLVPGSRAGTCPANTLVFPKRGGAIGTNKKRWLRRSAILDPNLMGVHPHKNRLTMSFLKGWFQTFNLSDIASGSSVPQLNKQDLAPLKLALPPVEEQMEYARKIEDLSSLIRKMTRVDEYHNRLFFSLQQSAFEGEL